MLTKPTEQLLSAVLQQESIFPTAEELRQRPLIERIDGLIDQVRKTISSARINILEQGSLSAESVHHSKGVIKLLINQQFSEEEQNTHLFILALTQLIDEEWTDTLLQQIIQLTNEEIQQMIKNKQNKQVSGG